MQRVVTLLLVIVFSGCMKPQQLTENINQLNEDESIVVFSHKAKRIVEKFDEHNSTKESEAFEYTPKITILHGASAFELITNEYTLVTVEKKAGHEFVIVKIPAGHHMIRDITYSFMKGSYVLEGPIEFDTKPKEIAYLGEINIDNMVRKRIYPDYSNTVQEIMLYSISNEFSNASDFVNRTYGPTRMTNIFRPMSGKLRLID